jgi:hypothetical protein
LAFSRSSKMPSVRPAATLVLVTTAIETKRVTPKFDDYSSLLSSSALVIMSA